MFPSRLEDRHGYLFDVIQGIVKFQCAKRIQFHLRIIFSFDQDAHAVLEVYDVQPVV